MLRILLVLLALCTTAHSEESGPREPERKADSAEANDHKSNSAQQIAVPANSAAPTIINIFAGKHSGEESQCANPKDWKEWGWFAWCKGWQVLDAEKIIAAFTVILAFATYALWRATDRLVKGAEETARRQLRAYLTITEIRPTIYAPNNVLESISLSMMVASMGQTPGTVFDAFINKRVVPLGSPLPDGEVERKTAARLAVTVGTGEPQAFGNNSLSRQQMIDSIEGRAINYLFCVIRYTDIFGDEHEIVRATEFVLLPHPDEVERDGFLWADLGKQKIATGRTVLNYGHST